MLLLDDAERGRDIHRGREDAGRAGAPVFHRGNVSINRAIAVSQVEGPAAGLLALKAIPCDDYRERYPFLPMAEGEFQRRLGNVDVAANCFSRALDLARTEPERRFIRSKLSSMAAVKLS